MDKWNLCSFDEAEREIAKGLKKKNRKRKDVKVEKKKKWIAFRKPTHEACINPCGYLYYTSQPVHLVAWK